MYSTYLVMGIIQYTSSRQYTPAYTCWYTAAVAQRVIPVYILLVYLVYTPRRYYVVRVPDCCWLLRTWLVRVYWSRSYGGVLRTPL